MDSRCIVIHQNEHFYTRKMKIGSGTEAEQGLKQRGCSNHIYIESCPVSSAWLILTNGKCAIFWYRLLYYFSYFNDYLKIPASRTLKENVVFVNKISRCQKVGYQICAIYSLFLQNTFNRLECFWDCTF